MGYLDRGIWDGSEGSYRGKADQLQRCFGAHRATQMKRKITFRVERVMNPGMSCRTDC